MESELAVEGVDAEHVESMFRGTRGQQLAAVLCQGQGRQGAEGNIGAAMRPITDRKDQQRGFKTVQGIDLQAASANKFPSDGLRRKHIKV